jgi:hypothetical protein
MDWVLWISSVTLRHGVVDVNSLCSKPRGGEVRARPEPEMRHNRGAVNNTDKPWISSGDDKTLTRSIRVFSFLQDCAAPPKSSCSNAAFGPESCWAAWLNQLFLLLAACAVFS